MSSRSLYRALVLVLLFNTACDGDQSPDSLSKPGCMNVSAKSGGSMQGLEFINTCEHCMAVAFTFISPSGSDRNRTGCMVPASTRVLFPQAGEYSKYRYLDCDMALQQGMDATVTPQVLRQNYRSGICKPAGDFAD